MLRHINLSFPSRGLFFVVGKSGSGKSTLLSLLGGLAKPSEGIIRFNGRNLCKRSEKELLRYKKESVSFIFQHYNLLQGQSSLYNVMLPSLLNGEKRIEAKRKAVALLKAMGLDNCIKKKVDVLSGGEKQRVAIARALINSQQVILADEPTGALDEANSKWVMDYLFSLSKKKLIIVVTHNRDFIKLYDCRVIELESGRLKEEIRERCDGLEINPKRGRARNWSFPLIRESFKRNAFKNVVSFLSCLVCYCFLLLGVGYFVGSPKAIIEKRGEMISYYCAKATMEENVSVSGSPLTIVKQTRPDKASLESNIGNRYFVGYDYSFFFPSSMAFSLDEEKMEPCLFQPCFDITLKDFPYLFKTGEKPLLNSLNYCLVNEAFCNSYGESIGKQITFDIDSSFSYNGIKEEFSSSYSFLITGVVNEFSFMESPAVYYSYCGLMDILGQTELSALTKGGGHKAKLDDIMEECSSSSSLSSFGYLVFSFSKGDADALFNGGYGDGLVFSSNAYTISRSFSELSQAIESAIVLFAGLSLFCSIAITGMLSFSSFVEKKKESAILSVLGASKDMRLSLFAVEPMVISLLSCVCAFALSYPLGRLANSFLNSTFDIGEIVQIPMQKFLNLPLLLPLIMLFAALSISLLSALLPLLTKSSYNVYEELKDE